MYLMRIAQEAMILRAIRRPALLQAIRPPRSSGCFASNSTSPPGVLIKTLIIEFKNFEMILVESRLVRLLPDPFLTKEHFVRKIDVGECSNKFSVKMRVCFPKEFYKFSTKM